MVAHTPEDAKVGLAQVKMRDKTVWRAKVSFVELRPGAEPFRKTLTGIGPTQDAARERLLRSISRYNDGLIS